MKNLIFILTLVLLFSCGGPQKKKIKRKKPVNFENVTVDSTQNKRPVYIYNIQHPTITQFVEDIMFEYYWQEIKREPSPKYVAEFVKNRYIIGKTDPRINKAVEEATIKVLEELGRSLYIDHYAIDQGLDSAKIIYHNKN